MNLSRIIGPIVAGALLAASGSTAVFVLNAVLSLLAFAQILRWKTEPRISALPGERFVGAMRVGVQHVQQNPRMRAVLLRVFVFFFLSTALTALLPLVAQRLGGGARGFTLLMACMGAGAMLAVMGLPRWRDRYSRDRIVGLGSLVVSVMTVVVALAPWLWLAALGMAVAGGAWIATANTLTMAAQLALPNWVRARGMSTYQMALMGGSAAGAATWGQVAGLAGSVPVALVAAGVCGPLVLLAVRRFTVSGEEADLRPASPAQTPHPAMDIGPDEGPVMVTVEYLIDPARAGEFAEVMRLTRQARLRQGALSWGLFRDTERPGRYVEYFVDETWVEHLRRLERFTADDVQLRGRRLAFHLGDEALQVRRYVGEALEGVGR
jgi:MFS family permease